MNKVLSIKEAPFEGIGSYIAATNPFRSEHRLIIDLFETDGRGGREPLPFIESFTAEGSVCTFNEQGCNPGSLRVLKAKIERITAFRFLEACLSVSHSSNELEIVTVVSDNETGTYAIAVWEAKKGVLMKALIKWLNRNRRVTRKSRR
jgi:hypothetical protein